MSPTCPPLRLPWQRPLPSNGALNILQLWASGGRTREQILMKFGTQQQVRTAITVMRSNIKIFKIQNGGRPPCWKYIRNTITRLPINRLGRNLGGHISSCPRHVLHDAVAMATWHWTFCSYGREPISMKFGRQQHVRATITVTWPNINIFKF